MLIFANFRVNLRVFLFSGGVEIYATVELYGDEMLARSALVITGRRAITSSGIFDWYFLYLIFKLRQIFRTKEPGGDQS